MYRYEYEYVHVSFRSGILNSTQSEHKEIIDKYAQNGYRYVGYIPTKEIGTGSLGEMDLVFEKQES